MGINSVQLFIQGVLDGLALPLDMGVMPAYISPPNPGDGTQAAAYIWGSRGDESRRALPRALPGDLSSGAWKMTDHDLDVWLVWFGSSEDPKVNQSFPVLIDVVMATLRNTPLLDQNSYLVDPVTGQESNLLDLGERMSHEYAPVRATADQRYLRFDARVTVSAEEWFRA